MKALSSPGRSALSPHIIPATQGSVFNRMVPESRFAIKERGNCQALTGGTRQKEYYALLCYYSPLGHVFYYTIYTILYIGCYAVIIPY